MGVMFPLLAGCRLMFTAAIMVDITVVTHPACLTGMAIVGGGGLLCHCSDHYMPLIHLQGTGKDLIAFIHSVLRRLFFSNTR